MKARIQLPKDVVESVARTLHRTPAEVHAVIATFLSELDTHEAVQIKGFGTFYKKRIAAHTRPSPRPPHAQIDVPETVRLSFKERRGGHQEG